MHKVLVNCLGKSVVRWTDYPDMTIAVDWYIKHQTKQKTNPGTEVIKLFSCSAHISMKFVIMNIKIQTNERSRCCELDISLILLLIMGPGFDPRLHQSVK